MRTALLPSAFSFLYCYYQSSISAFFVFAIGFGCSGRGMLWVVIISSLFIKTYTLQWYFVILFILMHLNYLFSRQRAMKNGTPRIEVMTPVGNSLGFIIIRHKTSANNRRIPLKIILKGISLLDFGPTIFLEM